MGTTEFKYSASAELLDGSKTIERVDLSKGRGALKKLQGDERYQVRLTIDARFSGPGGPDSDATFLKGHPLGKTFEITWTVDAADGKAKVVGKPKKVESKRQLTPGDECEVEESADGDGVTASVSCLQYNLGADDAEDTRVFVCDLKVQAEPKAAPVPPPPKVPREITRTSAYFGESGKSGLDSANLPSSSLRDLDRWVKEIEKHDELYEAITEGDLIIFLEGNTSRSGSKAYNAKLAKQRIDAVERKLKSSFRSSKLELKSEPKAQSRYEEEHDYRVDVYFDKGAAEVVIASLAILRPMRR